MNHIRLGAGSLAVALLCACGGSNAPTDPTNPPSDGPPSLSATVAATPAIAFTPNRVSLLVGGTLTINFGSVGHNVFFDNQPAGAPPNISGTNANVTKTLTFPVAGTYVYDCHIHPGMHGTVVVSAPAP
jgi:plastocyanin